MTLRFIAAKIDLRLCRTQVREFLQKHLQPSTEDGGCLLFEPEPGQQIQLYLSHEGEDEKLVDNIGVCIPYPCLESLGDRAFQICFSIADHFGWQVFDCQVGDYIKREDIG